MTHIYGKLYMIGGKNKLDYPQGVHILDLNLFEWKSVF